MPSLLFSSQVCEKCFKQGSFFRSLGKCKAASSVVILSSLSNCWNEVVSLWQSKNKRRFKGMGWEPQSSKRRWHQRILLLEIQSAAFCRESAPAIWRLAGSWEGRAAALGWLSFTQVTWQGRCQWASTSPHPGWNLSLFFWSGLRHISGMVGWNCWC